MCPRQLRIPEKIESKKKMSKEVSNTGRGEDYTKTLHTWFSKDRSRPAAPESF